MAAPRMIMAWVICVWSPCSRASARASSATCSNPEEPQGSPQTQSHLPLPHTPSYGRLEDDSQVVQVPFQTIEPQELFGTKEVRLGLLRQRQVVVCVRSSCGLQFSLPLEAFQPELADGFQHDESGCFSFALRLLHQALVEQRRDTLKHRGGLLTARLAHRFGSSSVQPPTKRESQQKRRCSSAVSRS